MEPNLRRNLVERSNLANWLVRRVEKEEGEGRRVRANLEPRERRDFSLKVSVVEERLVKNLLEKNRDHSNTVWFRNQQQARSKGDLALRIRLTVWRGADSVADSCD